MKIEPSATSFILLRNNQIILDGKPAFENKELLAIDFLDAAYEHFQINYPKFFKMDNLCKTGFIAAELLLRTNKSKESLQPEEIGVIISNANSSLDTDLKYEESIKTNPSPSLFVYTLPNILIGELSIRHKIKGESACFVFDIFDAEFQTEYINTLFETGKVKICLSGWADFYNGKGEAFFYLTEIKCDADSVKHSSENINRLYNQANT
ncbi:MAG: 3-oxoacyl-ACP synthase [Bacteroidota bacterium]